MRSRQWKDECAATEVWSPLASARCGSRPRCRRRRAVPRMRQASPVHRDVQSGYDPGRVRTLSSAMPGSPTQSKLMRWVPGLQTARTYQRAWFVHDLAAGLVLTTMLVPVGIAYAEASGVPGICGLYATIIPLLAYAAFGPSRIIVLGPDSSLAAVILAVVLPLSAGDAARAVPIASAMAIVSGIACVAA